MSVGRQLCGYDDEGIRHAITQVENIRRELVKML